MWSHRMFLYVLMHKHRFNFSITWSAMGYFSALLLRFIFRFIIDFLECNDLCKEKDEAEYYSDKYPSGPWSRYLWQVMRGYFDEEEFRESQDVKRSYIERR